jgi:hypothetical protein
MLLVVYTTLLVKPVFPYLIDATQHIFNYSEHITTVHFENGQYHVHNQLKEETKKNKQQNESANFKKDGSQTEYIFSKEIKTLQILYRLKTKRYYTASKLVSLHLANDYPPPKA